MATLTTFAPFSQVTETWDLFLDSFDCFLATNNYKVFPGDRKLAVFLSICSHNMFKTARALLAPQKVQDVPWKTLLAKLKGHYAPLPSRIARCHAFRHRNQAEDETINEYMVALRTAALYCDFRDLEDILLDQLVYGVRDICLQCRLLAKMDVMLQTALKLKLQNCPTGWQPRYKRLLVHLPPRKIPLSTKMRMTQICCQRTKRT